MLRYHVTRTSYPAVPNCTRCDSHSIATDGATRVQVKKPGKRWPTIAWLCDPCAAITTTVAR